jgi:hypothetical protein
MKNKISTSSSSSSSSASASGGHQGLACENNRELLFDLRSLEEAEQFQLKFELSLPPLRGGGVPTASESRGRREKEEEEEEFVHNLNC